MLTSPDSTESTVFSNILDEPAYRAFELPLSDELRECIDLQLSEGAVEGSTSTACYCKEYPLIAIPGRRWHIRRRIFSIKQGLAF